MDEILNNQDKNAAFIELGSYISKLTNYGQDTTNISEPQLYVYLVYKFEGEINNGGFDQFFWNTSGNFANETVAALTAINAPHLCKILQDAINLFPNKQVPKDRSERQSIMNLMPEIEKDKWYQLDKKIYKFEYGEDIPALCFDYIRLNTFVP